MNGNNNGNMNTFELPPIRKIGPAVLPKPKNIKIQAGRVIRLNYSNNFTQQTWNNQLNQQDENEDEFIDHFSSISDNTAHRPIQEEVTNNDVDDDDDLPLPPPPSQQLLNEINNRLAKFENMPSRAKLVKIPVDDEVDYETAAASDLRYDKENDMSTSSTILSNDNSQSSNDLMNNGLILSTSRYKFPRKNSGLNSAQNQQKLQQSQMIPQSPPPPPTPPLPPPPPLPPVYPSSISPAKTCTINGMKPTTINFSADAGANGRPTITITTSRGPNSPTITATTSPTSSQSNIFSYNIPVQHMYQQQQQQLGNSTNSTNEMGPPGSPTVSNNTITLPLTANGGGNFIISASSLSGLPQEFLLNGNMITKPTLISNGSYIIPVSMKLMSGGGSNGAPNSPPPTLVGASSSSSSSLSSPPTINTTSINSPTHHRNNSSPSSSSSPHSPLSGHNSPSSSSTSTQHQFTASAGNNNGNISPTSPSSPLGNILIKTTNGGPGVSGRTRIEDEVDLLKDLLIKNLNSAVIKETQSQNQNKFYGVCNRCNEKIIGAENGLRAMENLFHVTCFVCYGCGTQLQGHHFYAMENRSFCENCYMRLLERCSYCSKPITDRILRATGKPFHPECFCCVSCKKNLDGIPFTVDVSNKIHCIECFHEKYAPRCFICHLPITPDPGQEETVRIVAMDRSFHVNCYKCEECGVSLSSNSENAGGCFPLDDHIYCKSCNLKLIRSLAMNGGMTHPSSPLSKFTPANSQAPRSTDL